MRVVTFNTARRREWLLNRVPIDVGLRVVDSHDRNGNVVFLTSEFSISRAPVNRVPANSVPANSVPANRVPANSVPKSLSKIQEILFDNAQDIPDGLYKDLMDALIIKG